MRELYYRGLHPPVQASQFLGSGSQPIFAATDQLGVSAPPLGGQLPNFIYPVSRLSTVPVSDETPLHRLAASDRQLRDLETNLAATRQAIDSFCDGGLVPPNPWWIRFRPYPGNWWTLDEFRLSYMGRFAPLHSGLGFRLIGSGSLLLLLVHLCLGGDHTTSHLASLPQIRPVAHFAQGVTLPPP